MGAVVAGAALYALASKSQSDATKSAASQASDSSRYATDVQKQMFDKSIALQEPWRKAGLGAVNQLAAGLAPGGAFATPFTATNWQTDPGYAFRMSEGMKALDHSAAARGGLISGSALKAAQRYGRNIASDEYQNAFNRYYTQRSNMLAPLQSLAGVGQTTAQNLGNAATTYGNNIGNIAMTNGANQGNTMLSAGNIRASQYGAYGAAADGIANSSFGKSVGGLFTNPFSMG